jgi:DNA-binding PucR family transcriptional regulator
VVAERLDREPGLVWRAGVSRARAGVGGVRAGFEEARRTLDVADLLERPEPVSLAGDLLVFQVLLRDRPALEELVEAALTPLRAARGGPRPLLEALGAYLAEGGVTLAAARRLHLSPRALTYRLARIAELTGHDPREPGGRYVLQTAALGARLLGWPDGPDGPDGPDAADAGAAGRTDAAGRPVAPDGARRRSAVP